MTDYEETVGGGGTNTILILNITNKFVQYEEINQPINNYHLI